MKHQNTIAILGRQRANTPELRQGNDRSIIQLGFDFDRFPAKKTDAAPVVNDPPASRFALRFAALLEADPSAGFDNATISELSREVVGAAAGNARDAYDAAEAGVNIYLARVGFGVTDTPAAIKRLLTEQSRLPLQTRRDQNQIKSQQVSAPSAEALVVVNAAAIRSGMTVLEPSAGTGNIAVLARLGGAEVDTNEIDPRRRDLLTLQGFSPTALDAERLDNLFPPEKSYHAVVMNPPFSATGGRVNGHRTAFGARHVEQALLRLKPGGRLVAIVGRGMAMERPTFRNWWSEIGERYFVRANVGIDGSEYAKFGTTFDHQIIVIDHDGPTRTMSAVITAGGLSIRGAYELFQELSKENVYERICRQHKAAGSRSDRAALPRDNELKNGSNRGVNRISPGGRSRGGVVTGASPGDDGSVANLAPARNRTRRGASGDEGQGVGSGESGTSDQHRSDAEVGGVAASQHARPDGYGVGQLEISLSPQAVSIEEGTVFAAYRVQKAIVRGSLRHPANVVESTAMACVEPPDVTYRHTLPPDVIAEGRVSNLQLEDVIYAGQATSVILPDGSRKGHWNGDGTGIGKGREIYAFIYNELEQGRAKHVHISASHQLCTDAERDRNAVSVPLPIIHQAKFKPNETILGHSGVFFG